MCKTIFRKVYGPIVPKRKVWQLKSEYEFGISKCEDIYLFKGDIWYMNDENKICKEWTDVSKTSLTFVPKFEVDLFLIFANLFK